MTHPLHGKSPLMPLILLADKIGSWLTLYEAYINIGFKEDWGLQGKYGFNLARQLLILNG